LILFWLNGSKPTQKLFFFNQRIFLKKAQIGTQFLPNSQNNGSFSLFFELSA